MLFRDSLVREKDIRGDRPPALPWFAQHDDDDCGDRGGNDDGDGDGSDGDDDGGSGCDNENRYIMMNFISFGIHIKYNKQILIG